uniref:Photosystem II core complex proteins psbY, chloroplastic n=1 Tax=Tanacetum cinerariifolium TaxID=118510 RepID=A0A6L2L412_TANCI|nr:photosystem II core complex proteins psbY, chloroplastic [Tanacetum cinerariifolium]
MRRHWWIPQKMLSEQNKKNRSFNLISPAVGTKSVARRINMVSRFYKTFIIHYLCCSSTALRICANHNFEKERRENVTAVDSYENAHYYGKKKKMVSDEAVAVLDALLLCVTVDVSWTKRVIVGLGVGGGLAAASGFVATPEASAPANYNRGTFLLIVIAPTIVWVLYNILQPALNLINKMRN